MEKQHVCSSLRGRLEVSIKRDLIFEWRVNNLTPGLLTSTSTLRCLWAVAQSHFRTRIGFSTSHYIRMPCEMAQQALKQEGTEGTDCNSPSTFPCEPWHTTRYRLSVVCECFWVHVGTPHRGPDTARGPDQSTAAPLKGDIGQGSRCACCCGARGPTTTPEHQESWRSARRVLLRGQCRQSFAYTAAGKAIPATEAGAALIVLRFLLISWLFKSQKEERGTRKGKERVL